MSLLFLDLEGTVVESFDDEPIIFIEKNIATVRKFILQNDVSGVIIWSWAIWDEKELTNVQKECLKNLSSELRMQEVGVISMKNVVTQVGHSRFMSGMSFDEMITWFTKGSLLFEFLNCNQDNKTFMEMFLIDDTVESEVHSTQKFQLTFVPI